MNNKGQVLVLFVLIIPFLLLLGVYIVDMCYISYHNNQLNNINTLVINDAIELGLNENEIKEYINKNDPSLKIKQLEVTSSTIKMTLTKEVKSIFGTVIGKRNYALTSSKVVYIND